MAVNKPSVERDAVGQTVMDKIEHGSLQLVEKERVLLIHEKLETKSIRNDDEIFKKTSMIYIPTFLSLSTHLLAP